jgi:hypothetical protein
MHTRARRSSVESLYCISNAPWRPSPGAQPSARSGGPGGSPRRANGSDHMLVARRKMQLGRRRRTHHLTTREEGIAQELARADGHWHLVRHVYYLRSSAGASLARRMGRPLPVGGELVFGRRRPPRANPRTNQFGPAMANRVSTNQCSVFHGLPYT